MENEITLIAGIRDGDVQAFYCLFDRYYQPLCCLVTRMLHKSNIEAEDVVQEVFVLAWEQRLKFASLKELTEFLFAVAVNKGKYILRKERRQRIVYADYTYLADLLHPYHQYEPKLEDSTQLIEDGIEKLSPGNRRVIKLYFYEGLTLHHIAATLKISVSTVTTHKDRAIKQLRKQM